MGLPAQKPEVGALRGHGGGIRAARGEAVAPGADIADRPQVKAASKGAMISTIKSLAAQSGPGGATVSVIPPRFMAIQAHLNSEGPVKPSEAGGIVVSILSLPRRVNASEICIRPTIDTTA